MRVLLLNPPGRRTYLRDYLCSKTSKADYVYHPIDLVLLSGTLALGMGDTIEPAAMTKVAAGGYALLPAGMHHSARAASAVTVQVEGLGPFALTYMNPADDPTQRVTRKQVEKGHPAR